MVSALRREFVYLAYYFSVQLEQILPYWALGVLIGSVISVFGKAKIQRAFAAMGTKKLGALGLIPASLLGIASPLCMYGTIPIAASFSQKGVRDDLLAAFMMSSILLNPQLIIYSAALGEAALAIRVVSCFLCGIAAGLLVRVFFRDRPFFNFEGFLEAPGRDVDRNLLIRLIKNIGRNVKATGPWFLACIALTALYQRYVPSEWVAELFGSQRGFGMLLAATLGVPLYMCGGGTIPLISEWLQSGMSMGAAAAFMITGPATKITNLGAVKIVLGAKRFLAYLAFSAAFSLATGAFIDWVLRV